jgi:pyruvate ferredoxin oxidoreductase alpha subunit
MNGLAVHNEIARSFEETFGRTYGTLEAYRTGDADYVFVMLGSFATKAKDAVDRLRSAGRRIGLVRPRLVRPFPAEDLRKELAGKKAAAVIDQNLSMGIGGVIHAELCAALYGMPDAPPVVASFIGGLGGRDITPEEFFRIADVIAGAAREGVQLPPRLLYTEEELREVRKLQAIAHAERQRSEEKGALP